MGHHLASQFAWHGIAGDGVASRRIFRRGLTWCGAAIVAGALAVAPVPASAQSGEPIKIGFSMALTGPLAPNGKQALLGRENLGRGNQRQGRPARPQGPAHQL